MLGTVQIVSVLALALFVVSNEGLTADDITISGQSPFITDGTRTLTLTCQATGEPPSVEYSWGAVCASNTNTCVLTPQPHHDGDRALCVVRFTNTQGQTESVPKYYTLDLQYPPVSPPEIQVNTSREFLSPGDALTCTVHGGKPLVTSVNLTCSNPSLSDTPDVSNDTSVSSSVVIATSGARDTPMVCTCSAEWSPEPQLYSGTTTLEFLLEYKGAVDNFTVNGARELIVQEEDQPSLVFLCDTTTRSTASLTLHKERNSTLNLPTSTTVKNGTVSRQTVITSQVSQARCEDTGTYLCQVDNGFPLPDARSVQVNVTCGPRQFSISETEVALQKSTNQTVEVVLVANPVPHTFRYFYAGNGNGKRNDTEVIPGLAIQTSCVQHTTILHLVTCSIQLSSHSDDHVGVYTVSISNGLGDFNITIKINNAVPSAEDISIPLIASAAAGVVLVSIVFIFIICRCCPCRKKSPASGRNAQEMAERPDSQAESIMIRNSAYISANLFESTQGPFYSTPLTEPQGHYATVGPGGAIQGAAAANGYARVDAYERVSVALGGNTGGARFMEQPQFQNTPAQTPTTAENCVYAVVNKPKKQ